MKILFDFLPIILFFVAYKFFNLFVATAVAMVAITLQTGFFWAKNHRFETTHLISLVIILLLGGATLISHDAMFIKWKPTAIYWIFALLFLGTQFMGEKTLIQRMMKDKLTLPLKVWKRLNLSWGLFFLLLGAVNLYVVYNYTTNTWVDFKLFGALSLTIGFIVAQSLYMAKYLKKE